MTRLSNAEVARRLRERAGDTVVVRTASGTSKLHLPDPDADGAEPLCSSLDHAQDKPTRESDLASWPPGYRAWCSRCARQALGHAAVPEGELLHPGVAADGGEQS